MEEIVLYTELKKIGGSYYFNIKKSDVDFHQLKEGDKLTLKAKKIEPITEDDD